MGQHPLYTFNNDNISFKSTLAGFNRTMYFPLCGPTAHHLKSSITAYLSGDSKIDKDHYLTKPVSTEDLRQPLRCVYLQTKDGLFNTASPYDDPSTITVEAGQLWHKVHRSHAATELSVEILNFIPVTGENAELMRITVTNDSKEAKTITPTVAVPLFARALANKHDHEQVTSLLNRIKQTAEGVIVCPTMKFNEEGHQANSGAYFVFGNEDNGDAIAGSFPTVGHFLGYQGDYFNPKAIIHNESPVQLEKSELNGKEAVGALRFKDITLGAGESKTYLIMMGVSQDENQAVAKYNRFKTVEQFDEAFKENREYWEHKTDSIVVKQKDEDFNSWMRWVVLQPVLRRIFGCSFLPDHDYGKGGKGWRDIWQDLLSLILIEPHLVKEALFNNFAGVRIDGSNATIIGSHPGEFIADRNSISRVWMDHGVWPLLTLFLYVHQTGDFDILLSKQVYFKDQQLSRNFSRDDQIDAENCLLDKDDNAYEGTIIEHLLVQHLVQFFNVGEHNVTRLENADWNDGLDMAFERGESVAFTSQYAGNILQLAKMLEHLSNQKGIKEISIASELMVLLDSLSAPIDYEDIDAKKNLLFEKYFKAVEPKISGDTTSIQISDLVRDLRKKGQWVFEHIRQKEKVCVGQLTWFNGYYDNEGHAVEGKIEDVTHMTLTGQVFPIMSGLADEEEIAEVIKAVNEHLKDKDLGGYRLNSDFKLAHYLDLGRAFGFAYGTKENGAFFSHMIIMYAYALYSQGFVKEGYDVLQSIYNMSMDTDKSWIYPGVPEYFDSQGRGMYHYLTGSASWLVLTVLTQVFGVTGSYGDLMLNPKLMPDEFDDQGQASVQCSFASKRIQVTYVNEQKLECSEYTIKELSLDGVSHPVDDGIGSSVLIERKIVKGLKEGAEIVVRLG